MTSSQMPSAIAMPCPFANPFDGTSATVTDVATASSESTVNFPKGFGSNYAAPASGGGKYVTRGEMNGIGKAFSTDIFRYKCGEINTYDPAFATAVGGYPQGAVLDYIERSNYKLFKIVSAKDHNLTNPNDGVDGVDWIYLNTDNPVPTGKVQIGSYSFPGSPTSVYSAKIIIGTFLCPKSGILSIYSPNGEDTTFNTGTTPSAYIAGQGFMAKDIGTDATGNINWPTYTNANGFSVVGGLNSIYNYGTFIVARPSTGSGWTLESTNVAVQSGHYVAIMLVKGLFTSNDMHTAVGLGAREFTFYVQ